MAAVGDLLRVKAVDAGGVVRELEAITPPAWTALTLLNGWTDYGAGYATAAYRKMPDGRIELKGLVKSGTLNSIVGNLPAGYRPTEARIFLCRNSSGDAIRVDVGGGGAIAFNGQSANAWQSIELSFYP